MPGVYARAFMLGRLTESRWTTSARKPAARASHPTPSLADAGFLAVPDRLDGPRPDPGHLPGPLHEVPRLPRPDRRAKAEKRKVWAFLGDGETDEVESLGAIGMAGREKLDNLIFVINCNLQRLDGPVRGNGKIIQELKPNSAAPAGTSSS